MTTPDPQPDQVPGLEPGGGVQPGDTPPGDAASWGAERPEAPPGRTITPIAVIAIVVVVAAVVAFIIGKAAALY